MDEGITKDSGPPKKPSKPAAKRSAKPAPVSKPAAAEVAVAVPPVVEVLPTPTAKLHYTWEEAKKLVGATELEKLYGKPPGPLPFIVRDALGDSLCPYAEGQRDFFLDPADVNPQGCKDHFDGVAARLPPTFPPRVAEAWLAVVKKRGYVECFNAAADFMTVEIKMVEAAKRKPPTTVMTKPSPPVIPNDLKRKNISDVVNESAPTFVAPVSKAPARTTPIKVTFTEDDSDEHQPTAAAAVEQSTEHFQSISDMRRKMYRRTESSLLSPGFASSSAVASRNSGNMVDVDNRSPIRPRHASPAAQALIL